MVYDLNLNPESRHLAINIFHTAVESPNNFEEFAEQFYDRFRDQYQMLDLMIDILIRVSVADGALSASEEKLILSAVRIFNFDDEKYKKLKSKYIHDVEKYYAILGCDSHDSNDHIKKQYRRLVSDYHAAVTRIRGIATR